MNKEEKDLIEEMIDQLKEYASGGASGLYPFEESVKALLDYINQLEEDKKDLLFKKELLKSEIYEDTTSMDKVEKEFNLLKEKVNQLETNRDETFKVINTQLKNANEYKDNLRIIKFHLIKGSCTFEDLKTEEDYKY